MSGCCVNRLGSGLAGERLGVGRVVNTSPLPLLPTLDASGNNHTRYYCTAAHVAYATGFFPTFKQLGQYLNFSTRFIKNILLEQKKT
jgi:hypothetical protein